MDGVSISVLFLLIIVCLAIFIRALVTEDNYDFFLSLLAIIFLAVILFVAPFEGEPSKKIEDGLYQVSFVHERGADVVLGLEIQKGQTDGGLRVYIFPRDAFSGEIKKEAKQLKVSKAGNFRKLVLK